MQKTYATSADSVSSSFLPMPHTPRYVRCGSPDCKWQIALIDLSESELERLRGAFREHCIESHGLSPDDTDRQVWFDFEHHTMTLLDA